MPATSTLVLSLTCLILAIGSGVGFAKVIGTVQGASALHVRGGPGTEHPVLATLPNGEKVSVEEIRDDWILVETPVGERGYVHGRFLRLEGDSLASDEKTAADTLAAAGADAPSDVEGSALLTAAVATETTPAAGTPSSQNGIDTALEPARQSAGTVPLTDDKPVAGAEDTKVLAPQHEWTDLRADVDRLIGLTEEIRREVAGSPADFTSTLQQVNYGEPPGAVPILAVAGAGALVGFFLGTLFGQRQERSRRTRVRL